MRYMLLDFFFEKFIKPLAIKFLLVSFNLRNRAQRSGSCANKEGTPNNKD